MRVNHELKIEGKVFPVKVIRHARAKRLTLRLNPDGRGGKITVPPFIRDREIFDFMDKNRSWIETCLNRMPERIIPQDGGIILYEGERWKIIHLDRCRGIVEAKVVAGEPVLLVPGEAEHLSRRVIDFMRKKARERLTIAVNFHAATLSVKPKAIRITDSRSRWGSCSSGRVLSFSWRIIMAPPKTLNYLAAHEVAHLREMNHSDRFWSLIEGICPDMQEQKAWLECHGPMLHSIQPD